MAGDHWSLIVFGLWKRTRGKKLKLDGALGFSRFHSSQTLETERLKPGVSEHENHSFFFLICRQKEASQRKTAARCVSESDQTT